jgi:transcriptional regulator with XRE-family HTH domain
MFYDNLLKACERINIKITPLVTECGGAKGSISNWKKGAVPSSDIVVRLAERLNVSCDYLLTGLEFLNSESIDSFTSREIEHIKLLRQLSDEEQYEEIGRLKGIIEIKRKLKAQDSVLEIAEEFDTKTNRATKTA